MKKLVLLILSFTLSSQVFANVSSEYLDKALEMEKKFLLAVTTSKDGGERFIGTNHYVKLGDSTPTFYIKKTRSCEENPKCTDELLAKALASAQRFAADYNALIGKDAISVSDESSWGAIQISFVEKLGNLGRWYCGRGYKSTGSLSQCRISVRVNGNPNIGRTVAHEMLNVVSIQDTTNPVFGDCLTYDYALNNPGDYEGLCDVEKRAIIFALNHLRPGMRKGSVENAFDKHWKPSEFTYALATELEARYAFCQKFKSASCLKEFPSLKDS